MVLGPQNLGEITLKNEGNRGFPWCVVFKWWAFCRSSNTQSDLKQVLSAVTQTWGFHFVTFSGAKLVTSIWVIKRVRTGRSWWGFKPEMLDQFFHGTSGCFQKNPKKMGNVNFVPSSFLTWRTSATLVFQSYLLRFGLLGRFFLGPIIYLLTWVRCLEAVWAIIC